MGFLLRPSTSPGSQEVRWSSTVLGFLGMNQEELGFDPTIIIADGRRYIEVEWNSQRERLIIDEVIDEAGALHSRSGNNLLEVSAKEENARPPAQRRRRRAYFPGEQRIQLPVRGALPRLPSISDTCP